MPLYEYRCKQCGKLMEVIQKFSDAPLTVHEECGGELEKLLSAPGLHFKGSGFYINDYARAGSGGGKSGTKNGSTESKGDSGTSSSSSSSSDSGSSSSTTTPAPATPSKKE